MTSPNLAFGNLLTKPDALQMVTKLDKPIKREIEVDGKAFTATISAQGIKLVEKRHRKGKFVTWTGLIALGIEEEELNSAPAM